MCTLRSRRLLKQVYTQSTSLRNVGDHFGLPPDNIADRIRYTFPVASYLIHNHPRN